VKHDIPHPQSKTKTLAVNVIPKGDVAKRIAADAEAEANKKIAQSLTPELIEKQKVEKWNGSVPQVQGNSTPIISISQ